MKAADRMARPSTLGPSHAVTHQLALPGGVQAAGEGGADSPQVPALAGPVDGSTA